MTPEEIFMSLPYIDDSFQSRSVVTAKRGKAKCTCICIESMGTFNLELVLGETCCEAKPIHLLLCDPLDDMSSRLT